MEVKIFFLQTDWRIKLKKIVDDYQASSRVACTQYESSEQTRNEIAAELELLKRQSEDRLNKNIRHFCFPFFIGSDISAKMLVGAGYVSAHMGATIGFTRNKGMQYPLFVNRVQEEYFQALPGSGRRSLLHVLESKLRK